MELALLAEFLVQFAILLTYRTQNNLNNSNVK